MSNYENQRDKITVHLNELYQKHRTLDDEIKLLYSKFERDEVINRKKTEKLWYRDEIHRLESELRTIDD